MLVSVVIPYYQRDRGILRRALISVLAQKLPDDVLIDIIVVDDASPVPAQEEIVDLGFPIPFSITVIEQANGGVTIARNTALAALRTETTYIAFLDSDDSWREDHVATAVAALEQGYDFYFCDNEREGHHLSHFAADTGLILPIIERARDKDIPIALDREEATTLILRNFPCQISTTVYRRNVVPGLLFDTSVRNAGEDVIFFLNLVSGGGRVCFSTARRVFCGSGINLYFSNMGWETEGYLKRLIDDMRAHMLIQRTIPLGAENKAWNARYIAQHKRKVAFHTLRRFAKRGKIPCEVCALAKRDAGFYVWFPYYALQAVVGKCLGLYHPT